jgi:AcrR family transcriptional regulator
MLFFIPCIRYSSCIAPAARADHHARMSTIIPKDTPALRQSRVPPRAAQRPAHSVRPGSLRQQDYLLSIVYDLISAHGIDALTMRQVAQASNVSTGTINYHFQNKENLVISALENAYRLPKDWEQYRGSPAAQLRRIALSYVLRASSDRWWRFWINYLAASTRHEEMQAHQEVRFDKQLEFWSSLVADGIANAELRAELDPLDSARELLVLVHGLVAMQFMKPDAKTRGYARERINRGIDALLRNPPPLGDPAAAPARLQPRR